MSQVELIPLDKGHRLVLDKNSVTIIGRTPNIGCLDKKISRNHAELRMESDGTLWIKPIHTNPTFFKTKNIEAIVLKKDEEHQLRDSDQIGLLPTEYFYRISIRSVDECPVSSTTSKSFVEQSDCVDQALSSTMSKSFIEENNSIDHSESSTIPKLSAQENNSEYSMIDDHHHTSTMIDTTTVASMHHTSLEQEGGIILHTKRSLPAWMSQKADVECKPVKGRAKSQKPTTPVKTSSPSKYRTCRSYCLSI
jgi:hypothetical protein